MQRRILRALALTVGALVLVLVAFAIYLEVAGLGAFRGSIERSAGAALGRDLAIRGALEVDLLSGPRLRATDVTLANMDGLAEPPMLRIGQVDLEVEPLSLVFGPLRIPRVAIEDARLLLEGDPSGRGNWEIGRASDEPAERRVVLGVVEITGVEVAYSDPARGRSGAVRFDRVAADFGESGVTPEVRLDGKGRLGEIEIELHGRIGDLEAPERAEVRLDAHGPDLGPLAHVLGLGAPPAGPFRLTATATPSAAGGFDLALDATLPAGELRARGRMGPLAEPRPIELDVEAAGKDLATTAAWTGVAGLPAVAFAAAGRLRFEPGGTTLERAELRAGDDTLKLDGFIGGPGRAFDLAFDGSGPELSRLDGLAGVELPAEPWTVAGRLRGGDGPTTLEETRCRVGTATFLATGTIESASGPVALELQVAGEGADLSAAAAWFGVELPAEPFRIDGGLGLRSDELALESVSLRAAGHLLTADGTVALGRDGSGTALDLRLAGPDAAWMGSQLGVAGLPAEPYLASGRLAVGTSRAFDDLAIRIGQLVLRSEGRVALATAAVGTEIDVRLATPDASWLLGFAGLPGRPAWPLEAAGRLLAREDGWAVEDVEAQLGAVLLRASGRLGRLPALAGTDLDLVLQAPALSDLAAFAAAPPPLPEAPFTFDGRVIVEDETTYRLEGAEVELGTSRIALAGLLSTRPGLAGTGLSVVAAGPDATEVERWAIDAGLAEVLGLPAWPFALTGDVRVAEEAYRLEGTVARLGEHELRLDGALGRPPDYAGTTLAIEVSGPDATFPGESSGVWLPAEAYRARGRIERGEAGRVRLEALEVEVGAHRGRLDGVLGDAPGFAGTLLDLELAGPDLEPFATNLDLPLFTAQSYTVEAHLDGAPELFVLRDLDARFGGTDLAGWLRLDRQDRPSLEGELVSRRVDLTDVGAVTGTPEGPEAPPDLGTARARRKERRRRAMLSAEPLPTALLERLDAELRWTMAEVVGLTTHYYDAELHARLHQGVLVVDRLRGVDGLGGRFAVTLELTPEGDTYRLRARADMEDVRFDVASIPDDPGLWPKIELHAEIEGTGRSPKEIASGADGWGIVVVGPGRVDNRLVDVLSADVTLEMLTMINPWRSRERLTEFECGVLVGELKSGVLALGPIAARSNRVTAVGRGRIDLSTEKVDLLWTAKPRTGLGLGAGTVTNPVLKIGGTLGAPRVEVKPGRLAAGAGAAVVTGGLSLLAKTMWNRVTSGRQVCDAALKQAEKDPRILAARRDSPHAVPGGGTEPEPAASQAASGW